MVNTSILLIVVAVLVGGAAYTLGQQQPHTNQACITFPGP